MRCFFYAISYLYTIHWCKESTKVTNNDDAKTQTMVYRVYMYLSGYYPLFWHGHFIPRMTAISDIYIVLSLDLPNYAKEGSGCQNS